MQWRKKQEENKALKTVLQQTVRTAKNFRYMMTEKFKEMAIEDEQFKDQLNILCHELARLNYSSYFILSAFK